MNPFLDSPKSLQTGLCTRNLTYYERNINTMFYGNVFEAPVGFSDYGRLMGIDLATLTAFTNNARLTNLNLHIDPRFGLLRCRQTGVFFLKWTQRLINNPDPNLYMGAYAMWKVNGTITRNFSGFGKCFNECDYVGKGKMFFNIAFETVLVEGNNIRVNMSPATFM